MTATIHLFPILAILCYATASWAYIRALLFRELKIKPWMLWTLSSGFLFHVCFKITEYLRGSDAAATNGVSDTHTFTETLSFVSFILVALFLFFAHRGKLTILGAFIAPLATLFLLISGVLVHFYPTGGSEVASSLTLQLHIGLVLIAMGCFSLGFAISLALLIQDYALKHKRFPNLRQKLPPLSALDSLNRSCVGWGLLSMLLGILPGIAYALQEEVAAFNSDVRVISSLLIIAVYGLLFVLMTRYGARGRRAAVFSIIGFAAVCISLLGNFFGGSFHVY